MTMDSLFKFVLGALLRIFLLLIGLVFVASVLVVALVLLALWSLRALWARLTGRPVAPPLAFTLIRRSQWQRFYRAPGSARAGQGDVIDVEARQIITERSPPDHSGR